MSGFGIQFPGDRDALQWFKVLNSKQGEKPLPELRINQLECVGAVVWEAIQSPIVCNAIGASVSSI